MRTVPSLSAAGDDEDDGDDDVDEGGTEPAPRAAAIWLCDDGGGRQAPRAMAVRAPEGMAASA